VVQDLYREAYNAATSRAYKPVAMKADAKWAKWLHEHYSMTEIPELLRRAFSRKFKVGFPATLTKLATCTPYLVKENLIEGAAWNFHEPIAEDKLTSMLVNYRRYEMRLIADSMRLDDVSDTVLRRDLFDAYIRKYSLEWTAERVWSFFAKNWAWAGKQIDTRKGDTDEHIRNDAGDTAAGEEER
jgi:hypothetical protein